MCLYYLLAINVPDLMTCAMPYLPTASFELLYDFILAFCK